MDFIELFLSPQSDFRLRVPQLHSLSLLPPADVGSRRLQVGPVVAELVVSAGGAVIASHVSDVAVQVARLPMSSRDYLRNSHTAGGIPK